MIVPRKMTLQLTPLLDLLLIVIFAQYLEVQETQVVVEKNAAAALVERDEAVAAMTQMEERLQFAEANLEETLERERIVAKLLSELFEIPDQDIEKILRRQLSSGVLSDVDLENLKERIRQLSDEKSNQIVSHLLAYEEIRKRCDVWNIHVTPQNYLTLTSDNTTLRMQFPRDLSTDFAQQDFINRFIELAHTLPEPKSLVILMLTYESESTEGDLEPVQEALPQITVRLNFESAGRSRYDYADLGMRIE
ncbi:hypothetical protein [Thalassoglobus polymorphus]|uniref:Uncharacterized protein n=1 Tax=Thalassoglobus polymorphus TaxID=2527994 RepID=A0A517QR40_9PLAN|nr:hypothetical protein [Thalassoglobus polymorphus]QDT34097.1 hypothetical protein Mal48_33570 [Thalassoglobus polymorphus]